MISHRPFRKNIFAREFQTKTTIRYHSARTMAEAVREPNVFGLGTREAELMAEDLHDGGDATEGETPVASEAGYRGPRGTDPVEI